MLLSGLHYFSTILCYLIDCCSEHLCTFTFSQRILQLDAMARPHEYLFLDEAGFNLQKRRQRGRNIIGQRAITEVPGQRGGNITLCAAMGLEGLVHRHAVLGSYNTQHLLTFLEELKDILLDRQQHHPGPAHHIYLRTMYASTEQTKSESGSPPIPGRFSRGAWQETI